MCVFYWPRKSLDDQIMIIVYVMLVGSQSSIGLSFLVMNVPVSLNNLTLYYEDAAIY